MEKIKKQSQETVYMFCLSLSLSLSHTHTHTHTNIEERGDSDKRSGICDTVSVSWPWKDQVDITSNSRPDFMFFRVLQIVIKGCHLFLV